MNRRLEIREVEPGGPIELRGHAATFNQPYMVGSFEETIKPGAFKRSLAEGPDVSLLVNHQGTPLARTTSGTMTLSEDGEGLHVSAELEPSDPDVQAILPKMRRGDLSEMSFAFRATRQEWSDDKSERSVREASLHRGDVSIVSAAANQNATATVRAEELTLEMRQRVAERVGDRFSGPGQVADVAPGSRRNDSKRITVMLGELEVARARRRRYDGRASAPKVARKPAGALVTAKLNLARAKARRAVEREKELRAKPRYTEAEVQALGEKGLAHPKADGSGYHFPIVDAQDVAAAIASYGRAKPSERAAVREWIRNRAKQLNVWKLLPEKWQNERD